MLSATLNLILASVSLPPYLVINRGVLNAETPDGTIIVIPEGSWMFTNHITIRLDNREVILDNVLIFREGYE